MKGIGVFIFDSLTLRFSGPNNLPDILLSAIVCSVVTPSKGREYLEELNYLFR